MASVNHINRANLVWQVAVRQNNLVSKLSSLKDLTKKTLVTGAPRGGDVGAYAGGEGGGGRGGGRKAQADTAAPSEPSRSLQLLDVDAGLTAGRGGGSGSRAGAGEHGERGGGKLIGLFDDVIMM